MEVCFFTVVCGTQLILKGQYHCNYVNLKCKLLLNHAIYRKPGQNRTKNKRVTDMCIIEKRHFQKIYQLECKRSYMKSRKLVNILSIMHTEL